MDTKRLMAGTLAGFLMIGASPPTWANPPSSATAGANQRPATPNRADQLLFGMLAPVLTDPADHAAPKTCKPGTLYSAHDVVRLIQNGIPG
jgi:hypothetical protein